MGVLKARGRDGPRAADFGGDGAAAVVFARFASLAAVMPANTLGASGLTGGTGRCLLVICRAQV